MQKPIVSIIMATWNRAALISEAVLSVQRQTLQEWELLIVDDGSPDNTAEIVMAWEGKDARIKYLRVSRIGRIAGVSNVALRAAQGEFVAVLDDDDYWIDDRKLEKQVKFLREHPDYIACGGWFIAVDAEGREKRRLQKPETDEAIRRVMLAANGIANSTGMFRRTPAGLYDESLPQFADWDFYLRLGTRGKLYNFPEYFLGYRMWDRSSSFTNQRANAQAGILIVERYKDAYPGYVKAIIMARAYLLYTYAPVLMRRNLNAFLSRLKKMLFSK